MIFIPSAMLDPRLVVSSREKTENPQGKSRERTETRRRGAGGETYCIVSLKMFLRPLQLTANEHWTSVKLQYLSILMQLLQY